MAQADLSAVVTCQHGPVGVTYTGFGEMAVTVDGVRHPLTRRRERDVLAVLLAARGAPVAAERLVAEVWGAAAAGQSLAALQVAVSRLRARLEPGWTARHGTRLTSTAAGYALRAAVDDVDTWTFEARAEDALAAGDPLERLARCDRALALWSPTIYGDQESATVRNEAARLDELHLTLREHRARALLDLGRPDEAHRTLAELAVAHPFRERLWSLIALGQYRSSRQADALATLRTLRTTLAEELGVDPLAETRQLEEAMLRQDPALDGVGRPTVAAPAGVRASELAGDSAHADTADPWGASGGGDASVGRSAVLHELWKLHEAAVADRRARFVLVAGEAGIGKSRLVEDLVASAAAHGARVLVGRCLEGGYAPALWPWLGVVRPLGDLASPDGDVDPLLAPLLSGEPPAEDPGAGTTLRMYDAVVDLLALAADHTPLVVVLEDLHWADASSLLLLRHLAGAAPAAAVTVVCTRRTTEGSAGEALLDTMAALARAGADRVRLDGLDLDSVRTLLDRSVGPHTSRLDGFVSEVTAGNPFFVLQYARLLAALPHLADVDVTTLPVPDGVRDVLRQRVGRLPEQAAQLLASASVLGQVDPELLAELTGTPLETCLDVLDLALTSGLLQERQTGYAFVHALARETLYADLSVARRMRLHDRAGRLVEALRSDDPDAAAEIAHHAHVAAPLGAEHAERASAWLARAAAVAQSRSAHPEAVDLWRQVLSDTTPRSLTAVAAHRGMAAALIRLGRMADAHSALDAAVAIASEQGEWAAVAEAATVLSGAGPWSWREHGVVHAPLVQALTAAVPHVGPADRARLLAILQMEHFYGWNTALAEEYGLRSVELARRADDVGLLREVMTLRLIASSGSWDARGRLALAEELMSLDPEGEVAVTVLFHLGHIRWDCGDVAGADETMSRCAEAASALRHSGLEIPLGWWRATRARDLDDPAHGELIDEVLALHRRDGYLASRELECLHAVRRGPVGAPVAAATVAMAEQSGMPVRAMVAHALLESGEPAAARALLGEPASDTVVDYCSTAGRCLRLLVLCETGTKAEIRAALVPVEGHLGAPVSYGTIDHLGVVDHFVAAAYAALGDERAPEVARGAVEANRRLGVAPWLRRSEDLLARLS